MAICTNLKVARQQNVFTFAKFSTCQRHPNNFAINMFFQHIMQSIGASLVALSFALGCTVHSAVQGCWLHSKLATHSSLCGIFPAAPARDGKWQGEPDYCGVASRNKTQGLDYFRFLSETKTLELDPFWFTSLTKTLKPDCFRFTSVTIDQPSKIKLSLVYVLDQNSKTRPFLVYVHDQNSILDYLPGPKHLKRTVLGLLQ